MAAHEAMRESGAIRESSARRCFAPLGLGVLFDRKPGAMPRAFSSGPVGAAESKKGGLPECAPRSNAGIAETHGTRGNNSSKGAKTTRPDELHDLTRQFTIQITKDALAGMGGGGGCKGVRRRVRK